MEILSTWSIINLILVFTGAFILGLAKAGLRGIDMLNVTLMALVFGGKASTWYCIAIIMYCRYRRRTLLSSACTMETFLETCTMDGSRYFDRCLCWQGYE
jgi:hypothetical protein